jgi:hypothetical protein
MKRNPPSTVEFSIGPHSARPGWEVARIVYDSGRPEHRRQVDAAITAMVRARSNQEKAPSKEPERMAV